MQKEQFLCPRCNQELYKIEWTTMGTAFYCYTRGCDNHGKDIAYRDIVIKKLDNDKNI